MFRINTNILHKGRNNTLWIKTVPSQDYVWYVKLHGAQTREGKIIFNIKDYDIIVKGAETYFYRACNNLKDNLCIEHDSGNQPLVCKEFDETTDSENGRWFVVPSCLANYKREK